jgi:hypothetical protein
MDKPLILNAADARAQFSEIAVSLEERAALPPS